MPFVLKNLTASNISLDDIGTTIFASTTLDLRTGEDHQVIAKSQQIRDLVNSSSIAILDASGSQISAPAGSQLLDRVNIPFGPNDPQFVTITGDIANNSSAIAAVPSVSVLNDISDVSVPSPSDSQGLIFNASSGNWEAGSTSQGITLAFEWRFSTNTNTGVDPGNSRFRYNNASPILVTDISLDDETRSGFDVGNILGQLKSGDRLYIQQKDNALQAQLFQVTASATDSVGYWNIPVSALQVGLLPGNNKDCGVVLLFTAGGVDQNLWQTIAADSGSQAAGAPTATLTTTGVGGITTAMAGSVLTISGSGVTGTGAIIVQSEGVNASGTPSGTIDFTGAGVSVSTVNASSVEVIIPGSIQGDQAGVQARRTTAQTFTTSWVDVTLDATDFENDAAVIEHDAITDRITLKNAGPYLVFYRVDADPVADATNDHSKVRARIRVNDTGADLPGSFCENDAQQDTSLIGDATQGAVLTGSFIYDATADDFVTLQIQKTDTANDLTVEAAAGRVVFGAIHMTGEKGDAGDDGAPGAPGAGSTVLVEDEGILLATAADTLDFVGSGVTATGVGTTKTITIPGGGGAPTALYADFYDVGTTSVSTIATTIGIDSTRVNSGSAFTLAADEVTVDKTDTYAVHYGVSLDHTATADSGIDIWLEVQTVEVPGTRFRLFHDTTDEETSGHGTVILDLTATEVLRIRGQTFNGAAVTTQANGVRLTLHTFSGETGSTGATGAAGADGVSDPLFYGDQFETPDTADWVVNAAALEADDSVNSALVVRRFDDTTEEGVGFSLAPPGGTTSIKLTFVARAQTAPGAARTVGLKLYNRGIPDNAAVQSWSAGTVLTDIDIPTNAFFQYDSQTITLASMGITVGEDTQFELTRVNPTGGTELTGDWNLRALQVEYV